MPCGAAFSDWAVRALGLVSIDFPGVWAKTVGRVVQTGTPQQPALEVDFGTLSATVPLRNPDVAKQGWETVRASWSYRCGCSRLKWHARFARQHCYCSGRVLRPLVFGVGFGIGFSGGGGGGAGSKREAH